MKKETLQKILHIIITIITALATALTAQGCIKRHNAQEPKTLAHTEITMPQMASNSLISK